MSTISMTSGKKRVLIAGGAGFIGSHLCETYLQKGWEVLCLDNFMTSSRSNVAHLMSNSSFELVRHDIVEPYLADVDLVLNFACPASPVHYQHNAIRTIKTNVLGTMNLLGLAKRCGARFVQASTSEVYGDPKEHPQTESYWGNVNPVGIRSCYDEGKRVAETLCFDYHRQHGVDIRVIRIFNTYGPKMAIDDGRVVSNFIVQALRGEDLTVYGTGQQTRSFCFVDDLVAGIVQFAHTEGETGPINLGNDVEFTVMELAEEVLRQIPSKSKISYRPLPSDDPKTRRPELSKTKAVLNGWSPKVPLKEGIAKAIPWFRARSSIVQ
jgi:UDP-glucuronate decarboxylase